MSTKRWYLLLIMMFVLVSSSVAQDLGEAIKNGNLGTVQQMIEADEKGKLLKKKAMEDWMPLHLAVLFDQREIIEYLLARGSDPDPTDGLGLTPLLQAVKLRDMDVAKLLMANGANPSAKSKSGNTALHFAASSGSINMIDEFITRGLNVGVTNDVDDTPLHLAVREENLDMVKHLLAKGAPANVKNKLGQTPLHDAAMVGSEDILVALIDSGALVATLTDDHEVPAGRKATALHLATLYGNDNLFPTLLKYQGLSTIRNKYDATPVMVAIENGLSRMVDALLESGAAVDDSTDMKQPMDLALERDDLHLVAQLIDHGADVNRPNADRLPPLMVAVNNQQVEMVRLLIARGASVITPADGMLPLERAIEMQHVELMRQLIDAGADISDPDTKGRTPLYIAVDNDNVGMARLLLDKGANAQFISTTWKQTPIQLAIDRKQIGMLHLLVQRGALTYTEGDFDEDPIAMAIKQGYPYLVEVLAATDPNVFRKDEDGAGFLEYAILESKDPRVFHALLRAGVNPNEPTDEYGTPLHLAASKGNEAAVRVLLQYGANVNALNADGKTPLDDARGVTDMMLSVHGGQYSLELQ